MTIRKFFAALLLCAFLIPAAASAKVLDIQDLTTPKGIKFWLVTDKTLPVIAVSFAFNTGAAGNASAKQGLTQLLSNTMDEGAGTLKSEQFQGKLRDMAIDLSFDSSRDTFSGEFRTLLRHKTEALELLKLSLTAPRFDAEPVSRMREANLARLRSSMEDPNWISSRIMYDIGFKGHPYALNAGGTLSTLAKLGSADLKAEYKRIVSRERMYIGVTGDITADEAATMVDDVFGALPEKSETATLTRSEISTAGKPVFYAKDMPQTVLNMAWPGIGENDPDYYAAIVANYIYGGGSFSSRLMDEVREKRGLTYGIYSGLSTFDYADRMTVSANMQPQNVKATVDLVKSVAKGMMETDVPEDEIKAAKDYLIGAMPLGLSSTLRIAGTLTEMQRIGRPVTALDDYRAKIEAVTASDIRRVMARIFGVEPIMVLVGAKPDGIEVETVTTVPNAERPAP